MVLLLDDDQPLLDLYARLLEARQIHTAAFTDPQLALRSFRGAPSLYRGAVLDVCLPGSGMDGVMVAQALREMRPQLPIMFATGLEDGYNLARLREIGLVMQKRLPIHMVEDLWRLVALL